jgi:hypothetical protein
MMLFDLRGGYESRPNGAFRQRETDCLELDDLVSRAGDDLGLEVDAVGYLVLTEGEDFE